MSADLADVPFRYVVYVDSQEMYTVISTHEYGRLNIQSKSLLACDEILVHVEWDDEYIIFYVNINLYRLWENILL